MHLVDLAWRAALDALFLGLILVCVHRRVRQRLGAVFPFVVFNVLTFVLGSLMAVLAQRLGFAFGIFAAFAIIRYRTEALDLLDVTYLFVGISFGILNAIVPWSALPSLVTVQGTVVVLAATLEHRWFVHELQVTPMTYDDVSLMAPRRRADLVADVERRTGLRVERVEVKRIDLVRGEAALRIHHAPTTPPRNSDAQTVEPQSA